MIRHALIAGLLIVPGCKGKGDASRPTNPDAQPAVSTATVVPPTIGDIQTPIGYKRVPVTGDESFAAWLRTIPLQKDKTVYLFDGQVKPNQSAQFAVVAMSTGDKDLQQCADVVMRLRAEYLFQYKKYKEIAFMDYTGKWYRWTGSDNRALFDRYLQQVFGWCGSASLDKQLKNVATFGDIQIGDVLVQGGFPGHAVIVADMATDQHGKKIFLLVQGYQPAQDMHVLLNPNNAAISPWYAADRAGDVITPEWVFKKSALHSW